MPGTYSARLVQGYLHYPRTLMSSTQKSCRRCAVTKPLSSFYSHHAVCKSCRPAERKERAKAKLPVEAQSNYFPDAIVAGSIPKVGTKTSNPLPQKTWEALKRGSSFHDLCNELDVSPKRLLKLLEEAKAAGVPVNVVGNHVGALLTSSDNTETFDLQISPAAGELQQVGVISDLHFGSKYCLTGPLQEFVRYAYDQGVREILVPGDMLEGCYSHAAFERSAEGLDAQIDEMLQYLPAHDGLSYHAITGNHDWTFTNKSGTNVGRAIESTFLAAGRRDFKSYGDRGAFLVLRGARIHMWHPMAKPSYARSYQLQKKIEGYAPGEKPQILLAGHWHRSCYFEDRGVHAISCPTFQGGGSPYGRSLSSGPPCIGGLILGWRVAENGTIRDFSYRRRSYFLRERTHVVPDRVDADMEIDDQSGD